MTSNKLEKLLHLVGWFSWKLNLQNLHMHKMQFCLPM